MKGRGWPAVAVVGAVALVVAVWPGLFVVGGVVRGVMRGGTAVVVEGGGTARLNAWSILDTVGVALLIAVLATAIALPAAWAGRRLPGRVFLLYVVPMVMPSYLAYIGWGLIKAPGTRLGDFLLRGPSGAAAGGNWYPVAAAKGFAMGGLVLWAWPLAAVVMAAAFRRIDESVLDALRMEATWWGRAGAVMRMCLGGIVMAVAAVGLVMLGSAVPLHVAQMETYAVQVWRALDEVAVGERWRVWAGAWPLVVVAVGVGLVLGRKIGGGDSVEEGRAGSAGELLRPAGIGGLVVWGLSVVGPIVLLVASLKRWSSLATFWRLSERSFWWSAGIAGCVAVVGVVLLGAVWVGLSGRNARGGVGLARRGASGYPRVMVAACTVLLIAGLMPGVLVGSGTARAWNLPGLRWVGDSAAIVVIGHVARFGFVAVLAGWFLARGESRELKGMREMDAGGSVRGWIEAALPPQVGVVLGVGVVCGLLSFHEIEATVMLQPPTSMGGGFAWKVLQALHFAREEDLIPAMLIVMGVGLGLAGAAVGLLGLGQRMGRGASQ